MNTARAYQVYQTNQVNTVSQEKLVTMLYEGALRFIAQAVQGIAEKNVEKAHVNFTKAQAIVVELMSNLNLEAGEVSHSLLSLYDYMYHRLVAANIDKDAETAQEVYGLLSDLKDTWLEASHKVQNHNYVVNYNSVNIKAE